MSLATVDLKEAARAATKARRANQAERSLRAQQIAVLTDGLEVAQVAPLAYTAALMLMLHVGESPLPPIESTLDLQRTAETAKTLFTIARLASGESTSNVMNLRVESGDLDALAERIARLRAVTKPDTTSDPVIDG